MRFLDEFYKIATNVTSVEYSVPEAEHENNSLPTPLTGDGGRRLSGRDRGVRGLDERLHDGRGFSGHRLKSVLPGWV